MSHSRFSLINLVYACKLGLVAIVAYFFGEMVSGLTLPILKPVGGLWATISGIIVLRKGHVESIKLGLDRILGTLVGCVIGGLFLFLSIPFWFFPIAIFLTAILCLTNRFTEAFYIPACLACSVVIIIWQLTPKTGIWLYSFSRFVEATLGVVSAIVIAHIPPTDKKRSFFSWIKNP